MTLRHPSWLVAVSLGAVFVFAPAAVLARGGGGGGGHGGGGGGARGGGGMSMGGAARGGGGPSFGGASRGGGVQLGGGPSIGGGLGRGGASVGRSLGSPSSGGLSGRALGAPSSGGLSGRSLGAPATGGLSGRSVNVPSLGGNSLPRSGNGGAVVGNGGRSTAVTPRVHNNPGVNGSKSGGLPNGKPGSLVTGNNGGTNNGKPGDSLILGKPSRGTDGAGKGTIASQGIIGRSQDHVGPNRLNPPQVGTPSGGKGRTVGIGHHPSTNPGLGGSGRPGGIGGPGPGLVSGAGHHGGHGNFANAGGVAGRGHHSASYWSNNSYFFGHASPFGNHCQFRHVGYRPAICRPAVGWGWGVGIGIGVPIGLGWGYPSWCWSNPWTTWNAGFPCFSYNAVSPWYGYNATLMVPVNDPTIVLPPDEGAAPPADVPAAPAEEDAAAKAEREEAGIDFAGQGEREFFAGQYDKALKSFRHAMVEDPGNGACALLLAQALFQTGAFDEAAGATQLATQLLPEDKWGVVGEHRRELYGDNADYVKQLRSLENAIRENRNSPGLRFLLGWHYGANGYSKEAVDQLNKVVELAPKDEVAVRVRDHLQKKLDAEK